jgi:hypothetical protein
MRAWAGPLAEATLLGTVAVRMPGQDLHWDAAQLQVTNSPEATRFLSRTYRRGWNVPELGQLSPR